MIERKCEWCGKEFEVKASRVKIGWGRFCSGICQRKAKGKLQSGENHPNWRGGKIKRICKNCGCEFEAERSRVRDGQAKFCSRKCWGEWLRDHIVGEVLPWYQGGKIETTCWQCGKTYEIWPHVKERSHFCSRECSNRWRSENLCGENAHTWQGGIAYQDYPVEFNRRFKKEMRKRDNYTCQGCGEKNTGHKLDIHHIDYDKDNTVPQNCIALCRSCHSKTQLNREFWTTFFRDILERRGIYENAK